jgi:hypothetical protein
MSLTNTFDLCAVVATGNIEASGLDSHHGIWYKRRNDFATRTHAGPIFQERTGEVMAVIDAQVHIWRLATQR